MGKKSIDWLSQESYCAEHCPAWDLTYGDQEQCYKTQNQFTITALNNLDSVIDNINLVFCQPLVTRRLMPSVTVWTLIMCLQAFFRDVFLLTCCVCAQLVILCYDWKDFSSVNKIVLTSLVNIVQQFFWMTESSVAVRSTQLCSKYGDFEHKHFTR